MAGGTVVTVLIVVVVVLFFAAIGAFLGFLHYRNKNNKPLPLESKLEDKRVKIALFILKDVVIPVIGLVFFVITVIGLQNKNKWGDLDMHAISIAFYFFQSFKYIIIIFAIVSEYYDELDDMISVKLARIGIRADWKELLEGFIFIPSVIVDGMLINAEYYVGDDGNAFDGDGIVLLVVDTILWIKLCNSLLLRQYSQKGGGPPYQIKEFAYALAIFYYTVLLVFFFIVEHQRVINISRMTLTTPLIIILVNALTHAYVCSYSSMMAQGIVMFDKALRGSQARVTQLQLFIYYLRISPLPILITLLFMGWTVWVYVSAWIYTMNGHNNLQDEDESIQGLIRAVYILVQIFTGFLCLNLGYAILKRLGGYFDIKITVFRQYKFPDCSSYAEKINNILSQCTANFHLDHRAQVVVTSSARSPPSSTTSSNNTRSPSNRK